MNWKIIKEKYPKAYKEGQDWWVAHAEIYEPAFLFNIGNRFLYDFFDEQGIYIEILKMFDGNYTTPTGFYFYIDDYTRDEYSADTRTLAEEQAFIKAFEILEDKL